MILTFGLREIFKALSQISFGVVLMPEYKDLVLKAHGKRLSPTKMVVKAEGFEILIDKLNGEQPCPLDYTLAALAGCLNIAGTLVAKDMGIKIEDMEIEVEGVFNPAKFMGAEGERAGFKEIRAVIKVKSDADEERLKEWLERVEERCPISDNLANPTPTKVEIKKL